VPWDTWLDDVTVEHLIDLDELAQRLGPLTAEWRGSATVGPLTWRDEVSPWPQPIVSDRNAVSVPESLGLRLQRDEDEMEMVVWTGGWADVVLAIDGEARSLCPEFGDVDVTCAAVERTVENFLA
jgi:hypothetical protein